MRVAVSGLFYPVTMMQFFINALQRRDDVELFTTGPFFGNYIPWNYGLTLPDKYVYTPTLPLSQLTAQNPISAAAIEKSLPWEPDLWLQVDAGWHFTTRPPGKVVALVKTDPHVIKDFHYGPAAKYSDIVFCMQTPYIQPGERYLAYAFDPTIHYPMDLEKEWDACLIGLQYPQRMQLIDGLRRSGVTVRSGIGIVGDEYREAYNRSRVALSWSSLQDTPTRVYEAFGMGVSLVSNRTPDLCSQYVENDHFLGFDSVTEAIEKVKWLLSHPVEAQEIANAAHRKALVSSTWDLRIEQLFDMCGLNKKVFA